MLCPIHASIQVLGPGAERDRQRSLLPGVAQRWWQRHAVRRRALCWYGTRYQPLLATGVGLCEWETHRQRLAPATAVSAAVPSNHPHPASSCLLPQNPYATNPLKYILGTLPIHRSPDPPPRPPAPTFKLCQRCRPGVRGCQCRPPVVRASPRRTQGVRRCQWRHPMVRDSPTSPDLPALPASRSPNPVTGPIHRYGWPPPPRPVLTTRPSRPPMVVLGVLHSSKRDAAAIAEPYLGNRAGRRRHRGSDGRAERLPPT